MFLVELITSFLDLISVISKQARLKGVVSAFFFYFGVLLAFIFIFETENRIK